VTDGTFTTCPNSTKEWSDVFPVAFPASNSYLYVNQDASHSFLYLMYDFPFRKEKLAATDSVHVSFYTVEQSSGEPDLITYDVNIFGNGTMSILQQGKPAPAGRITSAIGYGVSPNSTTPHVMAELQVPLTAGPPSTYSPDPLYWSASLPPSPPPDPCPTQPGKSFNDCTKKYASIAGTVFTLGGIAAGAGGGLCTAGTIGLCAPAETGLIIGGAISAAAGYLLDKYVAGDPPGSLITIPPDPNYMVLATPATYSIALPLSGVPQNEVTAFNALIASYEQIIALEQAGIISIAREEGAEAAGDATWITKQSQAAQNFGFDLGTLLSGLPTLEANLAAAFTANGSTGTFTPADISQFQTAINPASPSSELQKEYAIAVGFLGQLGLSADDEAQTLNFLLTADPQSVATLGIGAFPNAMTDTASNTAMFQVGAALVQNAPQPTTLSTSFQTTLAGDYVAAGVGLRGSTSGNISLRGIPAGATVVNAFLYYSMLDNGEDPSLHTITMNGTNINASLIGSGPDTCWGVSNSFTYRADVASLITGNGTYSLTNVASGGSILAEGASLVVIYQLAGAPVKTIIIDDGNISMPYGSSSGSAAFTPFTATGPVSATTTFIVGDGQEAQFGIQTPTSFTGDAGTINVPNVFNSLDGPLWDTLSVDVSSVISPGKDSGTANINIAGDCLLWSAQAFSVTTAPVTTPVIATSGVVQAAANGDTLTNVRGLTPDSAPTIAEQIAMVVQFRTIQNPAISGPDLVTELVTNLVNDGVIQQSEAAAIIKSADASLVVPSTVATTTTLSDTPSTLSPGQTVTLTAIVSPKTGTAIPTGTVTFTSGSFSKTVTLDATGKASFSLTVPPPGTYTVTATYNGNSTFLSSTSQPLTGTVSGNLTSTLTLLAVLPPSNFKVGETVYLAAAVIPSALHGVPTGTVTFASGTESVTVAVGPFGLALFSLKIPAPGTYTVTASYSGSSTYAASVSQPLTEKVGP
jgi:hypothetical protein